MTLARARQPAGGSPAADRAVVSAESAAAQWDAYLAGHPQATSDHLWGWREVFASVFGHEAIYLSARRDGEVVGVLPLVLFRSRLFGPSVISLPFLNYGGVVADDPRTAAALLEEGARVARGVRAVHLELRHRERQFEGQPVRQHKLALTRPLPATVEALWAETDRKVRNQVRKAQKSGLQTASGGAELVRDFYAVFAENMRDLGTPVYPKKLFEEVLRVFAGRARLTVVRLGTVPVAGAVTVRWRETILVPWASSLRRFRALCPNMLLYWTLLEQATADRLRIFDFGRSSPGSGPHQFKRQWGAVEAPLSWEYVLLAGNRPPDHGPSNPKFKVAIAAWKRLPLGLANRLGPWISAQLP